MCFSRSWEIISTNLVRWVIKMMQLHRIEHSIGNDHNKTDESKECKICHYNDFNNGFKSHSKVCIEWDSGSKSFLNFAIIIVSGVDYRFFFFDMTEKDVIELISNFELISDFEFD